MATIEDGWRSLDDLRPNPANFNEHTKDGVIEKMAARIRCNAFTAPFIVTPDNLILGGHLRRLGLMKLRSDSYPEPEGIREGWQVPVRVFTGNAVQEKAILVGDNPALDDLSYDNEALSSLLAELQADGGLEGAGYSDADLDRLIGELAEQGGGGAGESGLLDGVDPDDVPEDAPTRCKAGDLWACGDHVIGCLDATDPEAARRLLGEDVPELFFADPPYGISLNTDWTGSQPYKPVQGDDKPFDPEPFLGIAPLTFLWGANHYANRLPNSDSWFVWDKQGGNKHVDFSDCEMAWTNKGGPARLINHIWDGFRRDSEKGEKRVHPTQKPVAVLEWALEWLGGEMVVDLFLGSGSTLIACEKLGRQCRGAEIDPHYCDVILARWERATGKTAELLERL